METTSYREEGEISDDDDLIITHVVQGKQQNLPVSQHYKSPKIGNFKFEPRKATSDLSRSPTKSNVHSRSNLGSLNGEEYLPQAAKNVQVENHQSNSNAINPSLSPYSVLSFHNTQNAKIVIPSQSSGFIDKMRKRSSDIMQKNDETPYFAGETTRASSQVNLPHVDIASIPTPPPPPLPTVAPPMPAPPPPPEELLATGTSFGTSPAPKDDIYDEYVDSLLEEATKQMKQDLDDMQDKTEVVDMELESSDDGEISDDGESQIKMTKPVELEDEDEDLDVLELRLAALASYAKSTREALEENEKKVKPVLFECYATPPSRDRYQAFTGSGDSASLGSRERKRKWSGGHDDSDTWSRKRHSDERREREKRLHAEERLRKEEERRLRYEEAYRHERQLREEEKRERKRLQEVELRLEELQNPTILLAMAIEQASSQGPDQVKDMFDKLRDIFPASHIPADTKSPAVAISPQRDENVEDLLKNSFEDPKITSATYPSRNDEVNQSLGEDVTDCVSMDMDSDMGLYDDISVADESEFGNLEHEIFTKVNKNQAVATSASDEKVTNIFPKTVTTHQKSTLSLERPVLDTPQSPDPSESSEDEASSEHTEHFEPEIAEKSTKENFEMEMSQHDVGSKSSIVEMKKDGYSIIGNEMVGDVSKDIAISGDMNLNDQHLGDLRNGAKNQANADSLFANDNTSSDNSNHQTNVDANSFGVIIPEHIKQKDDTVDLNQTDDVASKTTSSPYRRPSVDIETSANSAVMRLASSPPKVSRVATLYSPEISHTPSDTGEKSEDREKDENEIDEISLLRAQLLASMKSREAQSTEQSLKNVPVGQIDSIEKEKQSESAENIDDTEEATSAKETQVAMSTASSEDEDEAMLRAQLLASVARKRREKLEEEIEKQDKKIEANSKLVERKKMKSSVSAISPKSAPKKVFRLSDLRKSKSSDKSPRSSDKGSRSSDRESRSGGNSPRIRERELRPDSKSSRSSEKGFKASNRSPRTSVSEKDSRSDSKHSGSAHKDQKSSSKSLKSSAKSPKPVCKDSPLKKRGNVKAKEKEGELRKTVRSVRSTSVLRIPRVNVSKMIHKKYSPKTSKITKPKTTSLSIPKQTSGLKQSNMTSKAAKKDYSETKIAKNPVSKKTSGKENVISAVIEMDRRIVVSPTMSLNPLIEKDTIVDSDVVGTTYTELTPTHSTPKEHSVVLKPEVLPPVLPTFMNKKERPVLTHRHSSSTSLDNETFQSHHDVVNFTSAIPVPTMSRDHLSLTSTQFPVVHDIKNSTPTQTSSLMQSNFPMQNTELCLANSILDQQPLNSPTIVVNTQKIRDTLEISEGVAKDVQFTVEITQKKKTVLKKARKQKTTQKVTHQRLVKMKKDAALNSSQDSSRNSSPTSFLDQSPATDDGVNEDIKALKVKIISGHGRREVRVPVVEPVVINLQDDSSDDDHDHTAHAHMMTSQSEPNLLGSLDSFLKEARAASEKHEVKQQATTPEALKNLGPRGMAEYKQLREEIRRREEKLRRKAASVVVAKTATVAKPIDSKPSSPSMTKQKDKESEVKKVSKAENEKKIHQLGLRVQLQKKLIEQDEQNLDTLSTLVEKKQKVLTLAERKIVQLEKQLQDTRRILESNSNQISTLQEKCDSCRKQILDRKQKIKDLEAEKEAKQYEFLQADNGETLNGNQSISGAEILSKEEKERMELERLHAEYADMIQRHKEQLQKQNRKEASQTTADNSAKPAQKSHALKPTSETPSSKTPQSSIKSTFLRSKRPSLEHIKTEENMRVSTSGQEDNVNDEDISDHAGLKAKKRRRSLKDLTPTGSSVTRPNLSVKVSPAKEPRNTKRVKDIQAVKPSGSAASSRESSPKPSIGSATVMSGFKMPTGRHLSNMRKLHKENMEKDVWFSKVSSESMDLLKQCSQFANLSVISVAKYKPLVYSKSSGSESLPEVPLKKYSSPLLRFKSYRFNPYFRTKSRISILSSTYSNKVDSKRMFCRFDLTGTCNDDKCPWQHTKTVEMTNEEVLHDLVSYAPDFAGIKSQDDLDSYSSKIKTTVKEFRSKHPVTDGQQAILMVNKVNLACKHVPPHTTFLAPRKWRPDVTPKPEVEVDKESVTSFIIDDQSPVHAEPALNAFEDDVINEGDVRYYGSGDVQDLEAGVLDNPGKTTLWLNLAYKQLHDTNRKPGDSIDQALHVLSRGLEANKDCSELWLHYLSLYSRRKDRADFKELCKQALQYAPSYELHWKYLNVLPVISQKKAHCLKIETFLKNSAGNEDKDALSHRLLEILFYRAQLLVLSGRANSALQTLQAKCNSDLSVFTLQDAVFLCICYLYMLETKALPACIFEQGKSNPSRLVCKEQFVISWNNKSDYKTTILNLIQTCRKHEGFGDEVETVLLPLYKTLWKYLEFKGESTSTKVMKSLLQIKDHQSHCLLKLVVEMTPKVDENILQLYAEALQVSPKTDLQLTYDAAMCMISHGKQEEALELLEVVPSHFFLLENGDSKWDPNHLFCKLLKQPMPLKCYLPAENLDLVKDLNLSNLWACYSLLLELQGYEAEVEESYETAIASVIDTQDLRFIWTCYLGYKHKQLHTLSSAKPSSKSSQAKSSQASVVQQRFQHFSALVKRYLSTVPSRIPQPFRPDSYWLDYSFHTGIIEMYASIVKPEDRSAMYEDFVRLMPDNIQLVLRACEFFYVNGAKALGLGTSRVALEDFQQCLPLWKLHIRILTDIGSPKEYLLYAATHGNEENVKQILQKCKDFEINLGDFATMVLR